MAMPIEQSETYIHKYNAKKYQDFWNSLPMEIVTMMNKETRGKLSNSDKKDFIRLNVTNSDLVTKVNFMIDTHTCSPVKSVKYHHVMKYCIASKWSKNTKIPYVGYHATSIANSESILRSGFRPNSLFTCENIYQSLQVGERHGPKYVILLCLFNVHHVLDNEEKSKYEPNPWNWEKYLENLRKAHIDSSLEGYTTLILKASQVTIFGRIICDKKKYLLEIF